MQIKTMVFFFCMILTTRAKVGMIQQNYKETNHGKQTTQLILYSQETLQV